MSADNTRPQPPSHVPPQPPSHVPPVQPSSVPPLSPPRPAPSAAAAASARWREHLATWLPALLMLLFALGTWWLVRSAPQPADAPAAAPAEGPDYYMRDFSMRQFAADGALQSQLSGRRAQHLPASKGFEVEQPGVRMFDRQGHPMTASARRGEASDDGSQVRLSGQARVVREAGTAADGRRWPRLSFEGEQLHAFVDEKRLQSSQPVRLMRGADTFTADALDYDGTSGVALLQGRVHGTIAPGSAKAQAR